MAKGKNLNIASWYKAPASTLSNLAHTPFVFRLTTEDLIAACYDRDVLAVNGITDGVAVQCNSAEGLIQGLRCYQPAVQRNLCLRFGKPAKLIGKEYPTQQFLYLQGLRFRYGSIRHRTFVEWAIRQKFIQNEIAQQAMRVTADRTYTHNLGKFDAKPGKTSLWKSSFIRILHSCREILLGEAAPPSFGEVFNALKEDIYDEHQFYPLPTVIL